MEEGTSQASCSEKLQRPNKLLKAGRGIYCCIPNCGSAYYNNNNEKTGIGFFRFPSDQQQNQLWRRIVKLYRRRGKNDNFTINTNTRICEFHFKDDDIKVSMGIGRKTLVKNAVPIFKQSSEATPKRKPPVRRSPRKINNDTPGNTSDEQDETMISEIEQIRMDMDNLKLKNDSLQKDIQTLQKQLQDRTYCYMTIKNDEKFFKSQTGLEPHTFEILIEFLDPGENCQNIKFYEPALKTQNEGVSENINFCSPTIESKKNNSGKRGPKTKLDSRDQLLLFLSWLRGGLSLQHTAYLFRLPKSTVSRYLITWSNFMYFRLGAIPIWPSKESVLKTMPKCFKETYPSTRCIIDCTELFCQRPSSLYSQSCMYSSYKSHVTYKGLVGISPSGAISFISQLYEGSISDKDIVSRSGLLNKALWCAGDSIMADRGFTISEQLKPLSVNLNIPSFLAGKDQLSESEVLESQKIASVRIHVERAIQRIKLFKQLRNEIPATLHGSINQIWTVACLLCNFMSPLIQKDTDQ